MSDSGQSRFVDLVSVKSRSAGAAIARGVLGGCATLYTGLMHARNAAYDRSVVTVRSLPFETISIGNITTGGTGKTPVVALLAERYRQAGRRPAILTRGYKGEGGQSDEVMMLNAMLNRPGEPNVPIGINSDRHAAGLAVQKMNPDTDVAILDDGFQHRRLRRDCDVVLIDATQPFGYGHVLPRGLLREPVTALNRADIILITRCNLVSPEETRRLRAALSQISNTAPIYGSSHQLAEMRSPNGDAEGLAKLAGQRILAVSGIGNPNAFEQELNTHASVSSMRFPDHHAYTDNDFRDIQTRVRTLGVSTVVTTAKDWTKLSTLRGVESLPIYVVEMRLSIDDEQGFIDQVMSIATGRFNKRRA